MAQPWQASLFDDADEQLRPAIDTTAFTRRTEHRLDGHSWITHVPGLVRGHGTALREFAALGIWEQRRRRMYDRVVDEPRLTAEYAGPGAAPALVGELIQVLTAQFSVPFDRVWMNWYRDHDDGTGWHADRPANNAPTATIPVLSLGAARRFHLRPIGGGPSTVFTPAGGDLIVMHGRCQRDWQHCVPKQRTPSGPRMSLNFSCAAQPVTARSAAG